MGKGAEMNIHKSKKVTIYLHKGNQDDEKGGWAAFYLIRGRHEWSVCMVKRVDCGAMNCEPRFGGNSERNQKTVICELRLLTAPHKS